LETGFDNERLEGRPSSVNLRRFEPSKVYRRRSPLKSLVVKTLFDYTLPLTPMAQPLSKDLYKTLNMATIPRYPNAMPKESNKWLPKFLGNNVVTVEDHLYTIGRDMDNGHVKGFVKVFFPRVSHWSKWKGTMEKGFDNEILEGRPSSVNLRRFESPWGKRIKGRRVLGRWSC